MRAYDADEGRMSTFSCGGRGKQNKGRNIRHTHTNTHPHTRTGLGAPVSQRQQRANPPGTQSSVCGLWSEIALKLVGAFENFPFWLA